MTKSEQTSTDSIFTRSIQWLWNPFHKTAGATALLLGIIIILISGLFGSFSNTHFDGVLDTHSGNSTPFWVFLTEGIVNWLSLAVVLWIIGVILTKSVTKFRAIDLFGTQALARLPFLFIALLCFPPGYSRYTKALLEAAGNGQIALPDASPLDGAIFWIAVIFMIPLTIWFVALAWKSFRISCDVKGPRAIVSFIIGIIVAEILSKVIIMKGLASLIH